jgi:hypothetical protein
LLDLPIRVNWEEAVSFGDVGFEQDVRGVRHLVMHKEEFSKVSQIV